MELHRVAKSSSVIDALEFGSRNSPEPDCTSRDGSCKPLAQEDAMRIGIIGDGMIGSTLATLFVDAGHEVLRFLGFPGPPE